MNRPLRDHDVALTRLADMAGPIFRAALIATAPQVAPSFTLHPSAKAWRGQWLPMVIVREGLGKAGRMHGCRIPKTDESKIYHAYPDKWRAECSAALMACRVAAKTPNCTVAARKVHLPTALTR